MKLWLDTFKISVIEKARSIGIHSGVTTNPKIVALSGMPVEDLIQQLLSAQHYPVAVQVVANNVSGMIEQAERLHEFSSRIIVKVPATKSGLECIEYLKRETEVPVMATGIFTSLHALLCFNTEVEYIAPYYGYIRDHGEDPKQVLSSIVGMQKIYGFQTQILAAGIRSIQEIAVCAEIGVDAITINEKIFDEMISDHPGLDSAMIAFSEAWKRAQPSSLL